MWTLSRSRRARRLVTITRQLGEPGSSAPAESFLVDDGPARVGLVAAVTAPFCRACDRVRLTADGQIRNCLFARTCPELRVNGLYTGPYPVRA